MVSVQSNFYDVWTEFRKQELRQPIFVLMRKKRVAPLCINKTMSLHWLNCLCVRANKDAWVFNGRLME